LSAASTMTTRAGDLRNYALVTGAYWADTLADGAIRVLVLFYFYARGYSPFTVASLFLFYEIFGIVTNLVGGFLAARLGLKSTLVIGLSTQIVAIGMLAVVPESWLVIAYVMVAQALSGIAKDLTKMSSKSAVKLVAPEGNPGALYRWVAAASRANDRMNVRMSSWVSPTPANCCAWTSRWPSEYGMRNPRPQSLLGRRTAPKL